MHITFFTRIPPQPMNISMLRAESIPDEDLPANSNLRLIPSIGKTKRKAFLFNIFFYKKKHFQYFQIFWKKSVFSRFSRFFQIFLPEGISWRYCLAVNTKFVHSKSLTSVLKPQVRKNCPHRRESRVLTLWKGAVWGYPRDFSRENPRFCSRGFAWKKSRGSPHTVPQHSQFIEYNIQRHNVISCLAEMICYLAHI